MATATAAPAARPRATDPRTLIDRFNETDPIDLRVEMDTLAAFEKAKGRLATRSAILMSVISGLCRVRVTRMLPTYAVMLCGDGIPMLVINPDFAEQIGPDQVPFALGHEAYHIILKHLMKDDPALWADKRRQLAEEIVINHLVSKHLDLPLISVDGKVVIVDPRREHTEYAKDLRAQGLTPVDYDTFVASDVTCYAELCRMTKDRNPQSMKSCAHTSAGSPGDGSDGDGSGSSADGESLTGMTADAAEEITRRAFEPAVRAAGRSGASGEKAKDQVLDFMAAAGDSETAQKLWGALGAGALRGETTSTRKTDLWEQWTDDAVGTRLRESDRLRWNRKITFEDRFSRRGRRLMKQGVVAIDTSGSMDQRLVDKLASLVQDHEDLDIKWVCFDGDVWPFQPGEAVRGGGGTSFAVIDDWIEQQVDDGELDEPDFVLVVTDGYAEPITPRFPDSWIWLITPGGSDWPDRHRPQMSCRVIEEI